MITSCSPGWINFLEKFYPELIPHASTCRSPMSMLSVLAKTYYAEKAGIDPKKIFMVAVMPCVAKKFEASRPEHRMANGTPYTDAVLTTRELIWMIKCYGIHFTGLPDGRVRRPLGHRQRRRRYLRHHRRRDGGHAAGGQRIGDRQARRPARVHRGPRRPRPARNLRCDRRAEHSRRRGQRLDQCQAAVGQGQGRQNRSK